MPLSLNKILGIPTRDENFRKSQAELDREQQIILQRMQDSGALERARLADTGATTRTTLSEDAAMKRLQAGPGLLGQELGIKEPFAVKEDERRLFREKELATIREGSEEKLENIRQAGSMGRLMKDLEMRPQIEGAIRGAVEPYEISADERRLRRELATGEQANKGAESRMRLGTELNAVELGQVRADEDIRRNDEEARARDYVARTMFKDDPDSMSKASELVAAAKSSGLLSNLMQTRRTQAQLPGAVRQAAEEQDAAITASRATKEENVNRGDAARTRRARLAEEIAATQGSNIAGARAGEMGAVNQQIQQTALSNYQDKLTTLQAEREILMNSTDMAEAERAARLAENKARTEEATLLLDYLQNEVRKDPMARRIQFSPRAPGTYETVGGSGQGQLGLGGGGGSGGEEDWRKRLKEGGATKKIIMQ